MVKTGTELLELFSKFVLLGQIVKVHSCSKYKHHKKNLRLIIVKKSIAVIINFIQITFDKM